MPQPPTALRVPRERAAFVQDAQVASFSSRRTIRFTLALPAALALATATPAHAVDYCVSNVSQLHAALDHADSNDVTVKMVQGTYDIGAGDFPLAAGDDDEGPGQTYFHDVKVRGGYTAACASRVINALNTVITGSGRFVIRTDLTVEVESVRFTLDGGVLLASDDWLEGSSRVTLRRVRIENASTHNPLAVRLAREVELDQVIVANNPAGVCAIDVRGRTFAGDTGTSPEWVQMTFSVVAGNNGPGLCVNENVETLIDPLRVLVYNSIFWDNGLDDILVRDPGAPSSDVVLSHNVLQSASIFPSSSSAPIASVNADPQFGNPANGIFVPLGASPAVNSGAPVVPGGVPTLDIAGNPRPVGTPDRGAHETVFDDSVVIVVSSAADLAPPNVVEGSLRWAIEEANEHPSTHNEIRFAIPGGCPRVITLADELPSLVGSLTIDGFTQPGSSPNTRTIGNGNDATLCVGVRGGGVLTHGLQVAANSSANLRVRGLGLGGFSIGAIRLADGGPHVIEGNQFGGSLGATALGQNAVGVRIGGDSRDTIVGGFDPAHQNLIMGSSAYGIQMLLNASGDDTTANQIIGNMIGPDASGTAANANASGIYLVTGGTSVINNVISGNTDDGIVIDGVSAVANLIADNRIGVVGGFVPIGPADLPNGGHGIHVKNGATRSAIVGNWIAYNGADGVNIESGDRNRVQGNRIYDNGGFGIDLGNDGLDPIDNDGSPAQASYANRGLNRPTVGSAAGTPTSGAVEGHLQSTNGTYTLRAFSSPECDASGFGEAADFIGSTTISITTAPPGGSAIVDYLALVTAANGQTLTGRAITVIATDSNGNTSEISSCESYVVSPAIFADGFESGTTGDWSGEQP